MGDPGGIGPEVLVKSLADGKLAARARFVILGPEGALRLAADHAGLASFWTSVSHDPEHWPRSGVLVIDEPADDEVLSHAPTGGGGALSFALVDRAISMAMTPDADPGHADAIVTGPISKEAWALAGHAQFPGHTELLASRAGAARHAMMFVSPALRAILVTTHVPLARVAGLLTQERILEVIRLGHEACLGLGLARPRLAVCGLNPHAGEHGLLGEEDDRAIAPAVARARAEGMDVTGPLPGDTVWSSAAAPPLGRGAFDLVVAMYHDQALAPLKLVAWRDAVNLTVGLPFVRTSPDHGTAFDIAGRNLADPSSMRAAIALATDLGARRIRSQG
jgi:4-hydroxythreonine-4-phosphate dehydrogenase